MSECKPTTSKNAFTSSQFMYILIDNIPLEYHTPDLRNFFSYSIENESFELFNYRHRPNTNKKCNMCICKIKSNKFDELVKLYDKKNWLNKMGFLHINKCSIVKIKINESSQTTNNASTCLSQDELNNLLEFRNIPKWMKNGNVGTPTKIFVDYINQAIMPVSLISKLGINLTTFKKNRKRKYTNVKYDYENQEEENDHEDDQKDVNYHIETARTANGFEISEELDNEKEIKELNNKRMVDIEINDKKEENEEEEEEEDGDDVEEWERHEALNDDVTKQDRTSPYFFENEIELKWEKGGSGLVFYTDNNFWKDLENKDFDAETADDLDIDMSGYYDPNNSNLDKDAADIIEMNKQEMLRKGSDSKLIDDEKLIIKSNPFNGRSKNFGKEQLKKLGWKEGDKIGLRNNGLLEPLDGSDGKTPADKRGLGYFGEKVDRNQMTQLVKSKRLHEYRSSPYYIGSKFENVDKKDSLLRRHDPTMKYRQNDNN